MALDWTTIIVAGIGSFGVVGAAWVQRQRKQEYKAIRETLGTQNGQGNLVEMAEHNKEMLEFIKQWILLHEARHVYGQDATK